MGVRCRSHPLFRVARLLRRQVAMDPRDFPSQGVRSHESRDSNRWSGYSIGIACRWGELQIPRLPPDFLSGLVISVNLMRLSSKKAAYAVVDESSAAGNPEFAPNDTAASGAGFSAAPTALRLSLGLSPSPSGLGSRLAAGPPGLASMAILLCHSPPNSPMRVHSSG
jgi:hypothetical protein